MDLFNYLQDTFGVLATESELNEIKFLVLGEEKYIAESNGVSTLVNGAVCKHCGCEKDKHTVTGMCLDRVKHFEANLPFTTN